MQIAEMTDAVRKGLFDGSFSTLYKNTPASLDYQRNRYIQAIGAFEKHFGARDARLFSAPGRTEVGGNHTDHNAGHVLAASVDMDVLAVAARAEDARVRVWSDGYGLIEVSAANPTVDPALYGTSAAILLGMLKGLRDAGYMVGGFDAFVTSNVLKGSGLSSSAAFEVCIGTILNYLYNGGRVDAVEIAKIAQFAECAFFGKPCGLMDQTASAVGGFITIDFEDFNNPVIEKVTFDFAASCHALCVVDTGGNHVDLTADYAAIANEMKAVAAALGADVLRRTSCEAVVRNIPELRKKVNDRAILRALHFFGDDARVLQEVASLKAGDFARFKELVVESGRSSFMVLQNAYSTQGWQEQGISLALALSENILKGRGAWRVHGGGFAGTIQAFVPDDLLADYREEMTAVFSPSAFHELMVRPVGAVEVLAHE